MKLFKTVIKHGSWQKETTKNAKVIAAADEIASRLEREAESAMDVPFERKTRILKKRAVIDIATQDESAPYREAQRGYIASIVKANGGKLK